MALLARGKSFCGQLGLLLCYCRGAARTTGLFIVSHPVLGTSVSLRQDPRYEHVDEYDTPEDKQPILTQPARAGIPLLDNRVDNGLCLVAAPGGDAQLGSA